MSWNLHVPFPGPVSYNRRLGGRSSSRGGCGTVIVWLIVLGLVIGTLVAILTTVGQFVFGFALVFGAVRLIGWLPTGRRVRR